MYEYPSIIYPSMYGNSYILKVRTNSEKLYMERDGDEKKMVCQIPIAG